jgi:predicted nucleic acid-binding protein
MPTIIADAGPIIALIDTDDEHHDWAVTAVRPLSRPWITCAAVISEVTHHFSNDARALAALRRMIGGMTIKEPAPDSVLALIERYTPVMDYADGCAVLLAQGHRSSVVVTTDHRDFSTYRIPFISPKGVFHG